MYKYSLKNFRVSDTQLEIESLKIFDLGQWAGVEKVFVGTGAEKFERLFENFGNRLDTNSIGNQNFASQG